MGDRNLILLGSFVRPIPIALAIHHSPARACVSNLRLD